MLNFKEKGNFALNEFEGSSELRDKIEDVFMVPIPTKDNFWYIDPPRTSRRKKRRSFVFVKRESSKTKIDELHKAAIQSPGHTRGIVQDLQKKHPQNSVYKMISAMCSYGMLENSYYEQDALEGYKITTKEAAEALSNNISMFNFDFFLKIYFTFLDKLKLKQQRLFERIKTEQRYEIIRERLFNIISLTDHLLTDKHRLSKLPILLKEKMIPSHYTTVFDMKDIREAIRYVENGKPNESAKIGTASNMISYLYILGYAVAKIPILDNIVDRLLAEFTPSNENLIMRQISISSTRNIFHFKIATIEGNKSAMTTIGKRLLEENLKARRLLKSKLLRFNYEVEPFLNMAIIAEMTHGLFKDEEHEQITEMALKAMESVMRYDMSRENRYSKIAEGYSRKLVSLKNNSFKS